MPRLVMTAKFSDEITQDKCSYIVCSLAYPDLESVRKCQIFPLDDPR